MIACGVDEKSVVVRTVLDLFVVVLAINADCLANHVVTRQCCKLLDASQPTNGTLAVDLLQLNKSMHLQCLTATIAALLDLSSSSSATS